MANRVLAWILVSALGLVAFDAFDQRRWDWTTATNTDAPPTPLDGAGVIPPPK